jgi:hypothetical protein
MTDFDNADMRLAYLASEKGCELVMASDGTFTLIFSDTGAILLGPGATQAAVESFVAGIDPTIVGQV